MNLEKYLVKAEKSPFNLWMLNRFLLRLIPFNIPHKLWITSLAGNSTTIRLPYVRKNLNHLKGLHACALATLAEYTIGFTLLRKLSFSKYRIILKNITVDYYYQGKTTGTATFNVEEEWLEKNVFAPLKESEKIEVECEVKVYDMAENHLATGKTIWQIKSWEAVKTKV